MIVKRLVLDDPTKEAWTHLSVLFKPHHNTLTGNCDINVLTSTLESKGRSVVWHNRHNGASSISLDDERLMGIVLNVPVRSYVGIWRTRHWIMVRKIDRVWYNLDSDLRSPQAFENAEEVKSFLDHAIGSGMEVLLVMNDIHDEQQ